MANIKVAVRVRPISAREIHLTGSEMVVHTEPKTVSLTNLKVSSNKAGDSRERTRRYGFDYCFDSSDKTSDNYASQEMIYETLGEIILDELFKRYNSCLIAYGQSSSGKTYTMMGSKEDPGLTPRVCEGLFLRLADEEKSNGSFHVAVSYLEVYNERVRDLLNPSSNCVGLRVREHPRLGPYVQGLTHHAVSTLGSLISRVEEGTRARKTASTLQNPTSSRSHALLTLSLLPSSENSGQSTTVAPANSVNVPGRNDFPRGSKLHLVDLAGSESAAACGGANRQKEGANINKSLVALGNVISALADRGPVRSSPGRRFIPYRDSALTWLLKDVLGGNATTIMLATISPASGSYNETSHTLRFAQRAQSVINRPVINEDPVSRIIRELRAEVARLKSLLHEKNINPAINCNPVSPRDRDNDREIGKIGCSEREKEIEETEEIEEARNFDQRHSDTDSPEEKSASFVDGSTSHHSTDASTGPSKNSDSSKYNEAEVSEIFVNDELDEPVYVDIPTLVAVLIKPDDNIRADSHQIEEICSEIVIEDGNDTEFTENADRRSLIGSANCLIARRQSVDCTPIAIEIRDSLPPILTGSVETLTRQRETTPLRKQDSVDGHLSSNDRSNLRSAKKYRSIESLPRKSETIGSIETSQANLDKRNGNSDGIKKLNDVKDKCDRKNVKLRNTSKNPGAWGIKESQKRGSVDSDKSLKLFGGKTKKSANNGLTRKASKDSSSSGSKDELAGSPNHRASRKGFTVQEPISPRIHTPIQRASRAEIVTAVTERLYSSKKTPEDGNTVATVTACSTPVSETRSPESTDVKLAVATRMRLQEISRKMLAKRRKINVDTQTDSDKTVRVRDTASLTEFPKIISIDASVLTDRHDDYEIIPSTGCSVVRVKETSTITDSAVRQSVVRCKDVGVITDRYYAEYPTIDSPRNDSGIIMSDSMPNYSRSDLSITDASDFGVNVDRTSVESVDNSTNTITISGPSDFGSQTRREDAIDGRCRCCETRCHDRDNHCRRFDGSNLTDHDQSHRTDKNVISISLPDMISITIESSNGLESKIKVFDGGETIDDKRSITSKDNEVQTDVTNVVESATSTDDVFGKIDFHDISSSTKPFVGQTDGKTFRIENIFHKTGNEVRIKPTVEIVTDSTINESSKNSLTVTNSIGTIFVPETRENATGMEKLTNFRLNKRSGRIERGTSMSNDSFVKNTWPGRWRKRLDDSRRKPNGVASIDGTYRSLTRSPISLFDRDCDGASSCGQNETRRCPFVYELIARQLGLGNDEPEMRKPVKFASRINEVVEPIAVPNNKQSPCVPTKVDNDELELDNTSFSDDSLDPTEDAPGNEARSSNGTIGNESKSVTNDSQETIVTDNVCPPDVVAHTKKDNNESSIAIDDAIVSEDFEDSQQIVFPKIKLETVVPIDFGTPISDFKSLILGDSCCSMNRDDECNLTDLIGKPIVNVFRQDATIRRTIDDARRGIKSIIKKPIEKIANHQIFGDESKIFQRKCRCEKKVRFAVPEVFESTSSDSENGVASTSEDDNNDVGQRNIFEDYVDEAVILMRGMNSINEYTSDRREFETRGNDDRRDRGRHSRARSSNYIEYDGRRINLNDATIGNDDSEDDDSLNFNVESYEKCLRSMDRLENCLMEIRRHDDVLRKNYGIQTGGSTGTKLDLAKSSVDPKTSKASLENYDCVEFSRTTKRSDDRRISEINENVDGQNNNSRDDEKFAKHRGNDSEGGTKGFQGSQPCGFWKFFDTRRKDRINDYFQFKDENGDSVVVGEIRRKKNILFNDENFKSMKIDDYTTVSNGPENSDGSTNSPETKRVSMGPSKGIKSFGSRPQLSLSKYDSSNESSSSNEALETFAESMDDSNGTRDKFKYPGSPRSKFLELLSERRRIVENTRNTGVS